MEELYKYIGETEEVSINHKTKELNEAINFTGQIRLNNHTNLQNKQTNKQN